jgi:hypothetical protein
MPENGVIPSDGLEKDSMEFNSGIRTTTILPEEKAHLMV